MGRYQRKRLRNVSSSLVNHPPLTSFLQSLSGATLLHLCRISLYSCLPSLRVRPLFCSVDSPHINGLHREHARNLASWQGGFNMMFSRYIRSFSRCRWYAPSRVASLLPATSPLLPSLASADRAGSTVSS